MSWKELFIPREESYGAPFLAFRAFKMLTLDIAASIFLGVELGPETTKMNHVFEDLVAASMSFLRLRVPGTEFDRGLKGREWVDGRGVADPPARSNH